MCVISELRNSVKRLPEFITAKDKLDEWLEDAQEVGKLYQKFYDGGNTKYNETLEYIANELEPFGKLLNNKH